MATNADGPLGDRTLPAPHHTKADLSSHLLDDHVPCAKAPDVVGVNEFQYGSHGRLIVYRARSDDQSLTP